MADVQAAGALGWTRPRLGALGWTLLLAPPIYVASSYLAIAIALIMAPAAYHRQRGSQQVTSTFIRLASRLLLASMVPLAVSICIDFYLVALVIYPGGLVPVLAAALFVTIIILWFILPRIVRDR